MKKYIEILERNSPSDEIPSQYSCILENGSQIPAGLVPLWFKTNWAEKKNPFEKGYSVIWRNHTELNVAAFMEDSDVFSEAIGKNDKTWEKGDVLELFFQSAGGSHYFEVHLAPNLATLEYSIPDAVKLKSNAYTKEMLADCDLKLSGTTGLIDGTGIKGWWGWMKIPMINLGINIHAGFAGKFSVCRYNYNHAWGNKPDCSSSSALGKFSFHCPENWQELIFK